MKLLVISDIHSNLPALEAVWEAENDADMIVCAGDCVDFGFYPHEVIAWLRSHNVMTVRGNHDNELLKRAAASEEPHFENGGLSFLEYNYKNMTAEDIEYLSALPKDVVFECDGIVYYMAHTYDERDAFEIHKCFKPRRSYQTFERIWQERAGNAENPRRRMIFGHTHMCCAHMVSGETAWLNPGSISYRVNEDVMAKGADYIVIEDGNIVFKHLAYECSEMLRLAEEAPLTEEHKALARRFYGKE